MASNGERRRAYRILVNKSKAKRTLGRFRCGWEDNIKINLKPVGGCELESSGSVEGQVAVSCVQVMNLLFP